MTTTTYAIRFAATNVLAALVDARDEDDALARHWDDVRAAEEHRDPDAFRVSEARRMTVANWLADGETLDADELAALTWGDERARSIDAGVVLVDEDDEPLEATGGAEVFEVAVEAYVARVREADVEAAAEALGAEKASDGWRWRDDAAGVVEADEEDLRRLGSRLRAGKVLGDVYSEWCSETTLDVLGAEA
jgi:hypothetical protein